MFPNLKNALVELYSTDTFTSSLGNDDFKSVKAFLGKMNEVAVAALASLRRYRTSLWASVATKVRCCRLNSQNTPVKAGPNSSLLTAKMVLLIAPAKTDAGKFTDD